MVDRPISILAVDLSTDMPADPDATGYIDPPETPAPVFAVRAFKHAIFGTPQTAQPKQRRNSTTENGRSRNTNGESKTSRPSMPRPSMPRPKSANDAQTLAKQSGQDVAELPGSPTKGILLTPGTAAARKKNVTFGDHVIDNEGKKPIKTGLPDDCPGGFPNSGIKLADELESDEDVAKGRGRSKLTEQFEQVRDDSRKRKTKREKREFEKEREVPPEFVDPKSESGKYWKREYDVYRTNTQREVKKLVTKQKSAKSFAAAKDVQCTELANDLRLERKKVESLEAKIEELGSLMKDLHDQMRASQDSERKYADELAASKRQAGRKDSARPGSNDGPDMAVLSKQNSLEKTSSREAAKSEDDPVQRPSEPDPVQRPSEPYRRPSQPDKPKLDLQTLRGRMKAKPDTQQAKSQDDIWAQSFGSSSPLATRDSERQPMSPKGGRIVTSGTDVTPLQTLDVNAPGNSRELRRNSSPRSMDVECKSTPERDGAEDNSSAKTVRVTQKRDSPIRSPTLSLPSPEPPVPTISHTNKREHRKQTEDRLSEERSSLVPQSSPFHETPHPLPAIPGTGTREATATRPSQQPNTKENTAPASSKQHTPQHELHVKPSVMWSSINAPQATPAAQPSKRNSSMIGKDGKEVSNDRLEAARARIQARGRTVS